MMEIPAGYVGRGRVQGSAWQSPEAIAAAREKKEQDDASKSVPFEEFKSPNGKYTIFRQIPFSETTHKKANAYIELYKGKIEKVIIYFMKRSTCNEFCDLVRRQILNGIFKKYELELFLADDNGDFDDENEPPPSNEILAKIIDIGLDSFYFKITNSWQLSQEDKDNLVNSINEHKKGLNEYQGALPDEYSDDDSDEDDGDNNLNEYQGPLPDEDSDDDDSDDDDGDNNDSKNALNKTDSDSHSNSQAPNNEGGCCIIL
eukprot:CAMPEP_0201595806 /NCGR_PEP_ID=MMETSP0190_2-20130828/192683_1 /ASSEMBLY_ACC=CAM_ASM_000263 /TAXON_ID=37353 /ORGANISM="Rosalina sp." /LENGTH=258 /DNA_ID=CAMNT_0048055909 /DNA_START=96 /DNA_END=872 /DNA_ORIENTATION=+